MFIEIIKICTEDEVKAQPKDVAKALKKVVGGLRKNRQIIL
jgi:hypothetical protein